LKNPDLARFARDTELAQALLVRINQLLSKIQDPESKIQLMEVCGTHTMAISALGVRRAVDPRLRLISGPGCPVCVTAQEDLDAAIELARRRDITIATFGDMMRVPGSSAGTRCSVVSPVTLEQVAAAGGDVRVVYSPLDAVKLAQENPARTVVFLGVGFETTAPTVAAAVKIARARKVTNFLVVPLLKTMPQALRAIAGARQVRVDGFLLPGHVSTIIGAQPYEFLAREFHKPCCIAGFELLDVLQGILMLLEQLRGIGGQGSGIGDRGKSSGRAPQVEIQYKRSVTPSGNREAQKLMAEVFAPSDAVWRGLGCIPGSGLAFNKRYETFDARRRLDIKTKPGRPVKGCRCGDILLGAIVPPECKLFARVCTPENPVGPCMVSSEGACAAYYKYEI